MSSAAQPKQVEKIQRLRVTVRGAVQGVGFRPFIYRLARDLNLSGWVNNSPQGVFIEVEGPPQELSAFRRRIEDDKPPRSFIQSLESSYLDPVGFVQFDIRPSEESGAKSAIVLPDIATCADCLEDVFDPANRRYLYPFTNCTNCGPRYSIIESLPYDRAGTTMKNFEMCPECRAEYEDPLDRRFHAQPNACSECGPHVELRNRNGSTIKAHHSALIGAASAVRDGKIVAVKGVGGFHLIVDARNDAAIGRLRERKHRDEKPFAVMFPDLASVEAQCDVSPIERRLLASPESPIVILKTRRDSSPFSSLVAPGNPYLGALLPYAPLHHLLMRELGFPVVATSGNLSDEPICIDEYEAIERLANTADLFLVHDRPIVRHVDDSIVREMAGREMVLRRARGFAPLPIPLGEETVRTLAVGAHLKNAVALSVGKQAFVSQHIGDLETRQAYSAFQRVTEDLVQLYESEPEVVACDAHPDYLSTNFARTSGWPTVSVQHHYAHVLSCMAENELAAPVLGIAWDGTGYGLDGTIWGGEFLRVTENDFERAAHFRTFRLPGGDRAVKEPRRVALGLLFEMFGDEVFGDPELARLLASTGPEMSILRKMLQSGLNAPRTSSAGRLFDGVAALAGLRQTIRFEGQAAMELEFAIDGLTSNESYAFEVDSSPSGPKIVDWVPMIRGIMADRELELPVQQIAAKFHNTLVEMIVSVAAQAGEKSIALSGGCFQNKYLLERAVRRLRDENFNVYWHQRVPTNDGGIAIGQIAAAAREFRNKE